MIISKKSFLLLRRSLLLILIFSENFIYNAHNNNNNNSVKFIFGASLFIVGGYGSYKLYNLFNKNNNQKEYQQKQLEEQNQINKKQEYQQKQLEEQKLKEKEERGYSLIGSKEDLNEKISKGVLPEYATVVCFENNYYQINSINGYENIIKHFKISFNAGKEEQKQQLQIQNYSKLKEDEPTLKNNNNCVNQQKQEQNYSKEEYQQQQLQIQNYNQEQNYNNNNNNNNQKLLSEEKKNIYIEYYDNQYSNEKDNLFLYGRNELYNKLKEKQQKNQFIKKKYLSQSYLESILDIYIIDKQCKTKKDVDQIINEILKSQISDFSATGESLEIKFLTTENLFNQDQKEDKFLVKELSQIYLKFMDQKFKLNKNDNTVIERIEKELDPNNKIGIGLISRETISYFSLVYGYVISEKNKKVKFSKYLEEQGTYNDHPLFAFIPMDPKGVKQVLDFKYPLDRLIFCGQIRFLACRDPELVERIENKIKIVNPKSIEEFRAKQNQIKSL
jgi:hypothetical protein